MARDNKDLRIALFIDFENLVTRTGVTPESFDLQPALDKLLEKGKVVFRRAYCDWSRFQGAKKHLHDKGVELIDVPPSTATGKNGADIRLVIDALELAYQREHMDAFAIASGDSDFCPLAYKLRENNRHVIGLAVREATSPLFVKACDEFIYIRPPAPKLEKAEKEKKAGKQAEAAAEADGKKSKRTRAGAAPAKPAPTVPSIAREATAAILSRATEAVNPSAIKDAIVRRQPDFDVREHGFSTFTRMLEAMEKEGLLKLEQGAKGQWHVLPS